MSKVFISYSHDSDEHKAKVPAFSERLRMMGSKARAMIEEYGYWRHKKELEDAAATEQG